MAQDKPANPDPAIETPEPDIVPMDYGAHVRTYNRFLHLVKWFIIHMCFLVPALYFMIIAGNGWFGATLLAIGVVVLVVGLARQPEINHDLADSMDSHHEAG